MSGLKQLIHEIHRRSLWQVLLLYVGASYGILEATDLFIDRLGLPDWVFQTAFVLLVIGLPIVILTALVQAREPKQDPPDPTLLSPGAPAAEPTGLARLRALFTWRNAIFGGVLAFALLGIGTAGYMAMRVLGIGPVGSLVAKGVLDERERIILADFENRTSDLLLADAVTEAFRVDFQQSPTVTLVPPAVMNRVLRRMEKDPATPLHHDLAREVAIREGVKAVIAGEINSAGISYVLSARLVTVETGEVLVAYRETADDSTAIIRAIDRLSKKLRERLGESLRTIRSNEPLARVTTASLEALRKFGQARRGARSGDLDRAITLYEEAIALDAFFSMAWGGLAVQLLRRRQERARAVEALTKAIQHSDRLTDRERYWLLGLYYGWVTGERDKAITANRTLLDLYPDHSSAANNLGAMYERVRDYTRAEEFYRRSIDADSSNIVAYANVLIVLVALGEFDEAQATVERMAEKFPGHPLRADFSLLLATARGGYHDAEGQVRAWIRHGYTFRRSRDASWWLANLAMVRGQLAEAERHWRDAMARNEERGMAAEYLRDAVEIALLDVRFRAARESGVRDLDAALERYPPDSMSPLDRPFLWPRSYPLDGLVPFYAFAGRPGRARALLSEYESLIEPELRRIDEPVRHGAWGLVALAEGRPREAIVEIRLWDNGIPCSVCALPYLARAYDRAGEPDSAIAISERYIKTPWIDRLHVDSQNLAMTYERLGQLYEQRNESEKAIYYHGKFVDLWKDADPELQPRVEAARRAIAALSPDQ